MIGDWGIDEQALEHLRAHWPNAVHIDAASLTTCRYPLWDIRLIADRWTPVIASNDEHRYVCGDPTAGPLSSFCVKCIKRMGIRPPSISLKERRAMFRANVLRIPFSTHPTETST